MCTCGCMLAMVTLYKMRHSVSVQCYSVTKIKLQQVCLIWSTDVKLVCRQTSSTRRPHPAVGITTSTQCSLYGPQTCFLSISFSALSLFSFHYLNGRLVNTFEWSRFVVWMSPRVVAQKLYKTLKLFSVTKSGTLGTRTSRSVNCKWFSDIRTMRQIAVIFRDK